MIRESREKNNEKLMKTVVELLIIQDSVRALRQRLVDILLGIEHELEKST